MDFDIKKELQNMFLVENTSVDSNEVKEFTESLVTLDRRNRIEAEQIPVFENSINGKKCLCINLYDIFRYATANSRDEDLDIAKCFDSICAQNNIEDRSEYDYVVTIPKAQVHFIKEAAETKNDYTKMPTKLGELDRFMKYLKYDCINKGLQLASEK